MSKQHTLVGRTITAVRPLTRKELAAQDWGGASRGSKPLALVLDDGTLVFASRDDEFNGPGTLAAADGQATFYVQEERPQPAPAAKGR